MNLKLCKYCNVSRPPPLVPILPLPKEGGQRRARFPPTRRFWPTWKNPVSAPSPPTCPPLFPSLD